MQVTRLSLWTSQSRTGFQAPLLTMIVRRALDSASDTKQRARRAAGLRLQVTRFIAAPLLKNIASRIKLSKFTIRNGDNTPIRDLKAQNEKQVSCKQTSAAQRARCLMSPKESNYRRKIIIRSGGGTPTRASQAQGEKRVTCKRSSAASADSARPPVANVKAHQSGHHCPQSR